MKIFRAAKILALFQNIRNGGDSVRGVSGCAECKTSFSIAKFSFIYFFYTCVEHKIIFVFIAYLAFFLDKWKIYYFHRIVSKIKIMIHSLGTYGHNEDENCKILKPEELYWIMRKFTILWWFYSTLDVTSNHFSTFRHFIMHRILYQLVVSTFLNGVSLELSLILHCLLGVVNIEMYR